MPPIRSTGQFRRTHAAGKARDPSKRQRKRSRGPRVLMVGAAKSAP